MNLVLLGLKIGAAYAIGDWAGGKIAAAVNPAPSDGLRKGVKIATGVGSFVALSIVL